MKGNKEPQQQRVNEMEQEEQEVEYFVIRNVPFCFI